MDFALISMGIAAVVALLVHVTMPRGLMIAVMEILYALVGLFGIVCPSTFAQILVSEKASTLTAGEQMMVHAIAYVAVVVAVVSFLTRRSTNDESVIRGWAIRWLEFHSIYMMFSLWVMMKHGTTTETSGSGADQKTVSKFDVFSVPKMMMLYAVVNVEIFVALAVVIVQWPAFKVKIIMSSRNGVNNCIIFNQIFLGLTGLLYLLFPEWIIQNNEQWEDTEMMRNLMRLVGALFLSNGVACRGMQMYYSDLDKLPYFYVGMASYVIIVVSFIAGVALGYVHLDIAIGSIGYNTLPAAAFFIGYRRLMALSHRKDC